MYHDILVNLGQKEVEILDLEKLPSDFLFSALYENSGTNKEFNTFQDITKKSKRFVFVIPEYNGSFPGVIKSFIDGLEYPSPFKGKIAGLVGISSGVQGATLALSHMTDILNYLECNVLAIKPKCTSIESKFINEKLNDDLFLDLIIKQATELALS